MKDDAMYVLLQLRILISMATSSSSGSLMERAFTFLCISVSASECLTCLLSQR